MPQYDAGWEPFGRYRYDAPDFRPVPGYDPGFRSRPGPHAPDPRFRSGYDMEMQAFGEAVYGPERYGLGPYHERLRRRRRDDAELQDEVKEALFYDTWVDAEAIEVSVKEGVVTLSGELPSYEEIRYATDDAWDVDGVVGVRSELKLRT
jgi:hypothetical protein